MLSRLGTPLRVDSHDERLDLFVCNRNLHAKGENYGLAWSEYHWKCFYSLMAVKAAHCKASHCGPSLSNAPGRRAVSSGRFLAQGGEKAGYRQSHCVLETW